MWIRTLIALAVIFGVWTFGSAVLDHLFEQINGSLGRKLESCEYTFPDSYGPASGHSCVNQATIFNLSDESEYCAEHFQEVEGA